MSAETSNYFYQLGLLNFVRSFSFAKVKQKKKVTGNLLADLRSFCA
jgi:hypothetical protein